MLRATRSSQFVRPGKLPAKCILCASRRHFFLPLAEKFDAFMCCWYSHVKVLWWMRGMGLARRFFNAPRGSRLDALLVDNFFGFRYRAEMLTCANRHDCLWVGCAHGQILFCLTQRMPQLCGRIFWDEPVLLLTQALSPSFNIYGVGYTIALVREKCQRVSVSTLAQKDIEYGISPLKFKYLNSSAYVFLTNHIIIPHSYITKSVTTLTQHKKALSRNLLVYCKYGLASYEN